MPADLWAFRAARAVAKADRGCAGGDAIAMLALMRVVAEFAKPTDAID